MVACVQHPHHLVTLPRQLAQHLHIHTQPGHNARAAISAGSASVAAWQHATAACWWVGVVWLRRCRNPVPPHKHPLLLGITPQQGCQGTPNAACLCKGSLAGPPINAPVLLQWGLVGSDPWAQHALPLLSQTCLLLIRAQLTSALGISPA
jgi:hypothetical protein